MAMTSPPHASQKDLNQSIVLRGRSARTHVQTRRAGASGTCGTTARAPRQSRCPSQSSAPQRTPSRALTSTGQGASRHSMIKHHTKLHLHRLHNIRFPAHTLTFLQWSLFRSVPKTVLREEVYYRTAYHWRPCARLLVRTPCLSRCSEYQKKSDSHFCEPPKTRQQPTFALFCTIIGRVSLTVVFGMGTCVSSRVVSPDIFTNSQQRKP